MNKILKRYPLVLLVLCSVLINKSIMAQCSAGLSYSVLDTTAFGSIQVGFNDLSVADSFHNWIITFGDGSILQLSEPPPTGVIHVYDSASFYTATLTIEVDSGGIVICSDSAVIEVNACATPVWPGDANNDGIANNKDLLYIGLDYGKQTVPRFPSSQWLPFCSVADDTTNIVFRDCDGNAVVDSFDVIPVSLNYGQTHNKTGKLNSCPDTSAPPLYFVFPSIFLEAGDPVEVEIHLGSAGKPVVSTYGVAFSINYNKDLIDSSSGVILDFSNSQLLDSTDKGIVISKDFYSSGRIDGGISRTNQFGKEVKGRIGSMLFVLEDDLIQKTSDLNDSIIERIFKLDFVDVTVVDPVGGMNAFCAKTDSVTVSQVIIGFSNPVAGVEIYPNPAKEKLIIESQGTPFIEEVRVFSSYGQEVFFTKDVSRGKEILKIDKLRPGIYIIQLKFGKEIVQKKFVILNEF